jgi:hypothetical protein
VGAALGAIPVPILGVSISFGAAAVLVLELDPRSS